MRTIVFLTAGPYFWAEEPTVRRRYELLSRRYRGFILSLVSRKGYRRVRIGEFELRGCYLPRWAAERSAIRGLWRVLFMIGTILRLHWLGRRVDVVVAYDPLLTGLIAYVASRLTGSRLTVEVNGVYTDPDNWRKPGGQATRTGRAKCRIARMLIPFVLARADAVKLLYPEQLNGARTQIAADRCVCFHNFVAVDTFDANGSDGRYILFAGHPWYRKGVDVLIRAFNRLTRDLPDYRLRIVGYLPERADYPELHRDNPRIEFTGPVMPGQMIALMRDCSVVVLPSRSEAMGRVLLEAMASRKPIVASNVGGIPTYVKDGENGLLFRSEDDVDLSEKLRVVLATPGYARELAERGYRYMHGHLSEEAYLRKFDELVARASGEHRDGGLAVP